jgi:hypothetical protein
VSKDLKKMVAEIRGALDQYPREQLQEILAWVFKEYVVEGGAAPAQSALAMLDARTELEGLSFVELVTWLQLHLDVPELAALEVQGGKVHVRHGGRTVPIEVAARPPEPLPVAAAQAPTPPAPPPLQPTPPPNPAPPSNAAPPQPPAPTAPAPEQPKAEEKKDEGNPSSRFSWLEVD